MPKAFDESAQWKRAMQWLTKQVNKADSSELLIVEVCIAEDEGFRQLLQGSRRHRKMVEEHFHQLGWKSVKFSWLESRTIAKLSLTKDPSRPVPNPGAVSLVDNEAGSLSLTAQGEALVSASRPPVLRGPVVRHALGAGLVGGFLGGVLAILVYLLLA